MNRPRRSTRLFLAFVAALLVFATTCLASWVALWPIAVNHHFSWAHGRLLYVQEALEKHKATNGEYPDSLDKLAGLPEMALLDPWEHRFQYATNGDAYQLCSLGRDGEPGGVGFDTDIDLHTSFSAMQLPLSQFLFEAAGSQTTLCVAFLASVCALVASYVSTVRRTAEVASPSRLFRRLASHTALAVIVALFLAAYHFVVRNSGH